MSETRDEDEKDLRQPRAKGRVLVRRVADPAPPEEPFPNVLPGNVGPTMKIGVRFDQAHLDLIQGEIDRLVTLTPEVVSISDAIRSLMRAGAEHFRQQAQTSTDNETDK